MGIFEEYCRNVRDLDRSELQEIEGARFVRPSMTKICDGCGLLHHCRSIPFENTFGETVGQYCGACLRGHAAIRVRTAPYPEKGLIFVSTPK